MALAVFNSAAFLTASQLAVAANATVEVRLESTSALAAIFSDRAGTSGITNPSAFADASGRFTFYADWIDEGYSVEVTSGAESFMLRNVLDLGPVAAQLAAADTVLAARQLLGTMGLSGTTDRATNTILAAADDGARFVATGTFTQTLTAAATLGADWHVHYRVNAGQTVTFDPDAAELIDGAATKVVVGPASGYIVCDGSAFFTYGFDGPAASDTVAGRIEIATQAEQETGTDATRAVTPGRQHFHPSAAKAWVRFNGTGTVAIDADYGVSSITDHGTGDYTVNLDTAFSTANYSVVTGGHLVAAPAAFGARSTAVHDLAVGSFRVSCFRSDTLGAEDFALVLASAFGDQ